MSHANAALTPRARLRLARLIVDRGWPVARAAERYDVSWPTAKRWADRYRAAGEAGMVDRSSRPRTSPSRTPAPLVRKIVHLRWKQRLSPVEIGGQLGVPASTVHRVLVRCRLTGCPTSTAPPASRSAATSTRILARCYTSTSRSWATSPTVAAGATSGGSRAAATAPHRRQTRCSRRRCRAAAVRPALRRARRRGRGRPAGRVGLGRGAGVATGPFPQAAHRTRRAPLDATGSPQFLP